jgi:hypothetical protein
LSLFVLFWKRIYYGDRTVFLSNLPLAFFFSSMLGFVAYEAVQRRYEALPRLAAITLLVMYNIIDIISDIPSSAQITTCLIIVYGEARTLNRSRVFLTGSLLLTTYIIFLKVVVHVVELKVIFLGCIIAIGLMTVSEGIGAAFSHKRRSRRLGGNGGDDPGHITGA